MNWQQLQLSTEHIRVQMCPVYTEPHKRLQAKLSSLTQCQMREKTEGKIRFHLNHGSAALTLLPQSCSTRMGDQTSGLRGRDAEWKHLPVTQHQNTPVEPSCWQAAHGSRTVPMLLTCFSNFNSAHDLCFQLCAQWPAWQSRWSLHHHLFLTLIPLSSLYPCLFHCFSMSV